MSHIKNKNMKITYLHRQLKHGRGWTRTIDPLVNTNRSLLNYPSAFSIHLCKSIAADPGGFEPPSTVLETAMLPLHHEPV